ncbi:MAG: hypothetical protein ACUVTE_02375 [Candidatus Bathycorpusculaceae bacterium]
MPALTPSYLYTFFATIAVTSILLVSFMGYANAIRFSSETRKLKNLIEHVAAKATELLTLAAATNASAEAFLQAPAAIGEIQYWLRLNNDSARAWLEGGFGNAPTEATELRVYLPNKVLASGYYVSGYGAVRITCSVNADVVQIQLSSSSQNGG